jgi:hypothetical protein
LKILKNVLFIIRKQERFLRYMKYALNELPDINRRIKTIIDENFGGNVRRFSLSLGLPDSSKINRLFNKDKRTGGFPLPSCEIILLISNRLDYSTDWMLRGIKTSNKENYKKIGSRV